MCTREERLELRLAQESSFTRPRPALSDVGSGTAANARLPLVRQPKTSSVGSALAPSAAVAGTPGSPPDLRELLRLQECRERAREEERQERQRHQERVDRQELIPDSKKAPQVRQGARALARALLAVLSLIKRHIRPTSYFMTSASLRGRPNAAVSGCPLAKGGERSAEEATLQKKALASSPGKSRKVLFFC